MRIVGIKGGLGNQLFQYAYGKHLVKQGYEVAYNIDWFNCFDQRKFLLPELVSLNIIPTKGAVTDDGYWQDLKYTDPVKAQLMEDIKLQNEINAIAIHIRRGDYVGHKTFINLGMDYYHDAYREITRLYGDSTVFVFSDDPDWCADNMKDFPGFVVYVPDPVKAFKYMRRCKHKIIANSTFSWWAAYLSLGTTIAPIKWWTASGRCYEENILPNHWILC